jgi:hypothetical protein
MSRSGVQFQWRAHGQRASLGSCPSQFVLVSAWPGPGRLTLKSVDVMDKPENPPPELRGRAHGKASTNGKIDAQLPLPIEVAQLKGKLIELERRLSQKLDYEDLLELGQAVAQKRSAPTARGHKPSDPRLDTQAKFKAALEAAIVAAKDAWHPTRREVCDALGAKSENSLKDWLLYYGLLRHDGSRYSVARTLREIAEELEASNQQRLL